MALPTRLRYLVCLACLAGPAYGQRAPSPARWNESSTSFYLGLEGVILNNQATHFAQSLPFVSAWDKDLAPRPALIIGYNSSLRFALEMSLQDLPVLTGYQYEHETPTSYLGFGRSFTGDYLYVPVRGIVRVLGVGHRLGLSVLAGGGPAWTASSDGALITPNGTEVYYSDGNGTVGSGPTNPAGTTADATVTLQITREQTTLALFEAGLRGTWLVLPHLRLDLTVRQLWSTTRSARDISLDVQTPAGHSATTMTTPVRGVASGLSVRYSF